MLPDFAGTGRSAQHDKIDFFSNLLESKNEPAS